MTRITTNLMVSIIVRGGLVILTIRTLGQFSGLLYGCLVVDLFHTTEAKTTPTRERKALRGKVTVINPNFDVIYLSCFDVVCCSDRSGSKSKE